MQKEVVSKIIVGLLTITIVLLFGGLILFGFIGIVKIGAHFDLVKINGNSSLFSNVLYFGMLLFLIFIILLCIEMIVKIGIKFGNVAQSLTKTILLYAAQVVAGTFAIKLLIDYNFERIEVSLLAVSVSVVLFYVIVFFSSGAHKGMDDIWDE